MFCFHISQGIGIQVKKAEILSTSQEDLLWSSGLLGFNTPQSILNILVFVIGKGFALQARKEHHSLRSPPFNSQIQFMSNGDENFARYTEDIGFKTN